MQIRKANVAAAGLAVTLLAAAAFTIRTSGQSTVSRRSPVAPREEQVKTVVTEAYNLYKGNNEGKNADYIPALAKVDSKLFGVAVVTTDNKVVTVGDVTTPFSIQSISKVFTLALAMKERGAD